MHAQSSPRAPLLQLVAKHEHCHCHNVGHKFACPAREAVCQERCGIRRHVHQNCRADRSTYQTETFVLEGSVVQAFLTCIVFYTMLYYTVLCYTMPYCTMLYYAMLCYTILYHTQTAWSKGFEPNRRMGKKGSSNIIQAPVTHTCTCFHMPYTHICSYMV